jgi:hypothetical protein
MMREFAGISTYKEKVDFDEHFEEYYDSDDRVVYFSKKTFRHEEGGYLDFSYKYAIVVTDVGAYTGEEDAPIVVELMLVPSFNDLTEENKEGLRESGGYSDNEISEDWLWMDVLDYSYAVKMGEEIIDNPTDDIRDEWIESEPIKAILESVVAVYESIDRIRGFYLDRAWNMIGTTGWDILNNAINNEPLFKF